MIETTLATLVTFESFKQKVLQIREKVEEFKDNHKMASQAILVVTDSMPEPFNKFISVVWNGLDNALDYPKLLRKYGRAV